MYAESSVLYAGGAAAGAAFRLVEASEQENNDAFKPVEASEREVCQNFLFG